MTTKVPTTTAPALAPPPAPVGRGVAPSVIRTGGGLLLSPLGVSMSDAGRLTGLSARTIARLIEDGRLPAAKIGGRVVIRVVDIDAMLARAVVPAKV